MKHPPTEQNKPQRPLRGQTGPVYRPSRADSNQGYLTELKRVLDKQGMETTIDNGDLTVLYKGEPICTVIPTWAVLYEQISMQDETTEYLINKTIDAARTVREYTSLMEQAPNICSISGNSDYKLLAEFNGFILGGKDTSLGYQFTTWERDASGKGYTDGHYFDDYPTAKENFSVRSGLVNQDRLFSETEMTLLYRIMRDALCYDNSLSFSDEQEIDKLTERLEHLYPHLAEMADEMILNPDHTPNTTQTM